jgi:hypothetical protein
MLPLADWDAAKAAEAAYFPRTFEQVSGFRVNDT